MALPQSEGDYNRCPFCGEKILATAKKCKHCGEMLDPALRAVRAGSAGGDPLEVGNWTPHARAVAIHCAAWFVLFISMYLVVPRFKDYFMVHGVELSRSVILVLETSDWICVHIYFTLAFLLILLTLDAYVPSLLTQTLPEPVRRKGLFAHNFVMLAVPTAILVLSLLMLILDASLARRA